MGIGRTARGKGYGWGKTPYGRTNITLLIQFQEGEITSDGKTGGLERPHRLGRIKGVNRGLYIVISN